MVFIFLEKIAIVSKEGGKMSDYNWCHGPECHTHKTQDRIRGVKGSKVLRTRKIAQNNGTRNSLVPFL